MMVIEKHKWWTPEEDEELLRFMRKGLEEGFQVKYLAEQFAQKHPDLTPEQVRAHYYQLINSTFPFKNYTVRGWTTEEEQFMMQYIKENEKKKKKLELFKEIADILKKNPQAVASRYYFLIEKQKESSQPPNPLSAEQLFDVLLNKVREEIGEVREYIEYISQLEDKDREIIKLKKRIKELEEENKQLREKLQTHKKND